MIEVRTLTDGGQTAEDIAARLASFLEAARQSLDVAIYDFALQPATVAPIADAFRHAVGRGVRVRLAYNADDGGRIPVPPPPVRLLPALLLPMLDSSDLYLMPCGSIGNY